MNYNGTIYRPPIEADTFLLPVTEGCTHNSCTFCNMYRDVPFRMLPMTDLEDFLGEVQRAYGHHCDGIRRVYLVGADPFALSATRLLDRIALVRKYLRNAGTFTMYARTDNIAPKSDDDLKALRQAGVDDLYIGVECGLDDVLGKLNKGYTAEETLAQCRRLNAVGIRHCDLLMLGTAGRGRGLECAQATATLENKAAPSKILVNTMSAFAGTPLDQEIREGGFIPAGEKENLAEEKALLEALDLPGLYFWAVHPLDSVRIDGYLPRDRKKMADALEHALATIDESRISRISLEGTL